MRKNLGAENYLYPQPVMIIGTYDAEGNPDAMNAAWGGICGVNELVVDLGSHKTTDNILLNKCFTIGIADTKNIVAADFVGVCSATNTPDKMVKSGLHTVKSDYVNAPVITELPITLECELTEVTGSKYFGKIVNVSADVSILGEDGLPDIAKFTPITFDPVHHKYIELGKVVGNAFSDGKKLL